MSKGDRTPDSPQTSPEANSTEAAMSKVVQDLNAPGSKIDTGNSDLQALNANLVQRHMLPDFQITGMQANNDKLPGTEHHTEAVELTQKNGEHVNATYNPDTHQLTYQQNPPKLEGSKGPETVTLDMLTGQQVITAAGDGGTTRTTTVPSDGKGSMTLVTEGQTAPGEPTGKVTSVELKDSNGRGTKNEVPADAKDAGVDPETGDFHYTRADGVKVSFGANGSETMTTHNNETGKDTSVTIDGRGVTVATSRDGKVEQSFTHTDVNPDTVKMDNDGTVHMDRLVEGNGEHMVTVNGKSYDQVGTVTVAPNGQETTVINQPWSHEGGQITIVRDHSGPDGKVTKFEATTTDGRTVNLLGKDGNPLPGLSTDGNKLAFHYPNIETYPDGRIKSYDTNPSDGHSVGDSGVKVELNENGEPTKYHSKGGFNFERQSDGSWVYYQEGEGHKRVSVGTPVVNADGTVTAKEKGGFLGMQEGREHTLTGELQRTGGTALSGFIGNLGHNLIDDPLQAAAHTAGAALGKATDILPSGSIKDSLQGASNGLQNYDHTFIHPVDPDHASRQEMIGGALGSLTSLFVPGLGEIGKAEKAAEEGSKLAKLEEKAGKAKDKEKDRIKGNSETDPDPTNWKWWYRVATY